jgi:hypothetical protein
MTDSVPKESVSMRWLPITDNEPAQKNPAVLVTDGTYVAEVWRRDSTFIMTVCGDIFTDATHWMPPPELPKLPEESADE